MAFKRVILRSFKILFFNIFVQTIPLVIFNFTRITISILSTDIPMLALFYFPSIFFLVFILFSLKYHIRFCFVHFLHKIVKAKCKISYSKLRKGYICYIILI